MNVSEKDGEIATIVQHEGFVVGKILGGTKTKNFVYIYIGDGKFSPINQELADTAYMLMELIYCSILKRVGLKDDVIKELMRWHVLS